MAAWRRAVGTKAVATVNNLVQTVAALNMLHTMRWADNSMGSNFDYGWSDINQAFAEAGQVGMYVSGSDVLTNLVQASNIDLSIYGLGAMPTATGDLLEGRRPRWRHARRRAARRQGRHARRGRQVDRLLLRAAARQQGAGDPQREDAGRLETADRRVPALPVFDQKQYTLANTWIKPYVNVPLAQMTGYTSGIFQQKIAPEPAASTQSVYHSLDAAVEAVLTGAEREHPASFLSDANNAAQSAISEGNRAPARRMAGCR